MKLQTVINIIEKVITYEAEHYFSGIDEDCSSNRSHQKHGRPIGSNSKGTGGGHRQLE